MELEAPRGVVHVVSATRAADGRLHVLAIGPHAPKSDTDFFVLQLCRARADAVLTTARILREEPELSLDFAGPWAEALAHYRKHVLHKAELACAILTHSGDVPKAHPIFRERVHKLVLCDENRKTELLRELSHIPDLEVLASASGDTRSAPALLKERGYGAISVEAGPSTVASLYESPSCVDELWLSLAEVTAIDLRGVGRALPPDHILFRELELSSETLSHEQSGPWRFRRYVRK
jgi:riboflavin biosynthesis pyrimidine reductase